MHHDRDIDHSIGCIAFCRSSTVLNTLNSRTCRGITHGNVLNLWHDDSFFLHMSRTMCKMTNSTHHTLRSRLVRCFHLASFRVRFIFCALPSIPHFIISFHPLFIFFSESISIPKRCKGASTSTQWFGKFFFEYRWTDSSPRPCAK